MVLRCDHRMCCSDGRTNSIANRFCHPNTFQHAFSFCYTFFGPDCYADLYSYPAAEGDAHRNLYSFSYP